MCAKTLWLLLLLLSLAAPPPVFAEPPPELILDDSGEGGDASAFDRLAMVSKVFQVHFRSQNLPGAKFGSATVDRWRPEVRARVRFPIGQDALGQVVGRFRTGFYDVSGDVFGAPVLPGGPLDKFYEAEVGLQAAQVVDFIPRTFHDDEVWSIVGALFWRARWEPQAFGEGMTGGGSVGVGYALSHRVRLVLGITFESRLGRGGVRVRPTGALRWNVNERLLIRNRGLGAQVEYLALPSLSLFAAAYRSTSRFVLDRDTPQDAPLVFRDRPGAMLGAGLTWRISRHFRLVAEGGTAVGRKLAIRAGDSDWVSSPAADPSGYFEFRVIGGR